MFPFAHLLINNRAFACDVTNHVTNVLVYRWAASCSWCTAMQPVVRSYKLLYKGL